MGAIACRQSEGYNLGHRLNAWCRVLLRNVPKGPFDLQNADTRKDVTLPSITNEGS